MDLVSRGKIDKLAYGTSLYIGNPARSATLFFPRVLKIAAPSPSQITSAPPLHHSSPTVNLLVLHICITFFLPAINGRQN